MKDSFQKYKNYFLDIDESNFKDVIEAILLLHEIVKNKYDLKAPKFNSKSSNGQAREFKKYQILE
ncbi:MAG: hypothetical protein IPK91_06260 [Saprospiraceae bacterium]|nr:hypothetical protein [Saprospiraceae bacterium]